MVRIATTKKNSQSKSRLTEKQLADLGVERKEVSANNFASRQKEVDHRHYDWWSLICDSSVVCVPLPNYQQVHVAEHNWQKEQLRQKVMQQLRGVFVV